MLSKRSIQDASVAFFLNDMIDLAEFLEITNKRNPSFPYWKYERIEGTLDDMSESETKAEFKPGFHIVVSVVSVVSRTKKIHRTDRIHSISYKKLYLSFLLY